MKSTPNEQISGFGYCSCTGHTYVKVFKNKAGRYYVSIDYVVSDLFDDYKDMEKLWAAVEEVEKYRREMYLCHS